MKRLGIGYEDYKRYIDENLYYVDKTLLIRDLLNSNGMVTLFTRPRRFGKTLTLSMLRTFFEMEYDRDGRLIDNRRYFSGMKIEQCGESIMGHLGQYPVIKLSLKSAKQPNFTTAFLKLSDEILSEFDRHNYLLKSDKLGEKQLKDFSEILPGSLGWYRKYTDLKTDEEKQKLLDEECGRFATAIKTLSECLMQHHDRKVIILIDEYDVPLENSYFAGFYDKMVGFIRSLFESALKTNDALERAVITECLRISKESIFTGLNNLQVNSIRSGGFGEYFGFTQDEVDLLLQYYGLKGNLEVVKDWYDGYLFGETEVYNPWSLVKYVDEHKESPDRFPEPYWANTSSNAIIHDMVERADTDAKRELDELIEGGTIEKKIHEDITYDDVYKSEDNLWNFLFFTGYMRKVSERQGPDGEDIYLTMRIPNREIRSIYRNQISDWFTDNVVKPADRAELYRAIKAKDTDGIALFMSELFKKSISTFDSAESFYHGYMLSLMAGMQDYTPKSNREEGDGRPDITLYPENPTDPVYIFELKTRKKFNEMQDGLNDAYRQIREKRYEEGILDDGYAGVISFGVCFCKKSCIVGLYEG